MELIIGMTSVIQYIHMQMSYHHDYTIDSNKKWNMKYKIEKLRLFGKYQVNEEEFLDRRINSQKML